MESAAATEAAGGKKGEITGRYDRRVRVARDTTRRDARSDRAERA